MACNVTHATLNSLDPVCVFEKARFALVLQAATVEAALIPWTVSTWVVREGTAAAVLAVSPGWEGQQRNMRINQRQWIRVGLTTLASLHLMC